MKSDIELLHKLCSAMQVFQTHPYTVLMSVLFPVVSRVAEHQQVRRQPIRAAVAALSGDSCDLGPLTQADLQPLIPV